MLSWSVTCNLPTLFLEIFLQENILVGIYLVHLTKVLLMSTHNMFSNVQADLNLCWTHMSEGRLADAATRMYLYKNHSSR